MATGQLNKFIDHLRGVLLKHDGARIADDDLLKLYVRNRDESAFEALVRRYGPMVMGVCQRVLHNPHDAEDAFQATFLVLVRKASSLRSPGLVGNWLYGVAYRTALEARKAAAKRRTKEAMVAPQTETPDPWQELRPILDRELQRLPDKYRTVIILCDLQGRTRREAAQHLGCPEGTVASRLATARRILAKKLSRHGLAISAGTLAGMLSQNGSASVPASVMSSTIQAATLFAAGGAAASAISAQVAAITEGVLKTMLLTKLKIAAVVIVLGGFACYGLGLLAYSGLAAAQDPSAKRPSQLSSNSSGPSTPVGDPAPVRKPRILAVEGSLTHLVWSPDGKVMATVSVTVDTEEKIIRGEKKKVFAATNSTVKFWDVAKGELRRSLGEEKKVRISSIAFSPDGRILALAAYEEGVKRVDPFDVKLIDCQTGEVKKTIAHAAMVRALAFSPDGKTLAIGGQYPPENLAGPFVRTVQLWDIQTGKMIEEIKEKLELDQQRIEKDGYLNGLRDLTFSPDGKLLAAADCDYKVRLLDVQTGQTAKTLEGHTGVTLTARFSPDAKTLASGSADGTVKVWDVQKGTLLRSLERNSGQTWWSVAFSPDGKVLAAAGTARPDEKKAELVLWDTRSWETKPISRREMLGGGHVNAIAFSPGDGQTLAVGTVRSNDGRPTGGIELWRVADLPIGEK